MRNWIRLTAVVGIACLVPASGANPQEKKEDPAESAKLARDRSISVSNLKQIRGALRNYDPRKGMLPPAIIVDKKGKPLLSWRVTILPLVQQEDLYKKFKLDEPWDSDHNKKLLIHMPKLFFHPASASSLAKGLTHYRVFHGNGAMFDAILEMPFLFGVRDGLSNTWMIVEADEGIPWTKPDDFAYDPKMPLPKFATFTKGGFNALYGNGEVRFTRGDLPEKTIRALITANGGETIDVDATEILDELTRPIREKETGMNNLRNIAIGFHNHAAASSTAEELPRDIVDKKGKPLLSWRVAILPYLVEEDELWKEFRLDEAWDSEHNKLLLEKMPKVYTALGGKCKKGHTFYQSFAGPGALMNGNPALLGSIPDGTSFTFMVVEAGEAVPWTKPADVPYDAKKPLPKLGGLFDGDFHVCFIDGSVRYVKKGVKEENLKKFIELADGGPSDYKGLKPGK